MGGLFFSGNAKQSKLVYLKVFSVCRCVDQSRAAVEILCVRRSIWRRKPYQKRYFHNLVYLLSLHIRPCPFWTGLMSLVRSAMSLSAHVSGPDRLLGVCIKFYCHVTPTWVLCSNFPKFQILILLPRNNYLGSYFPRF